MRGDSWQLLSVDWPLLVKGQNLLLLHLHLFYTGLSKQSINML